MRKTAIVLCIILVVLSSLPASSDSSTAPTIPLISIARYNNTMNWTLVISAISMTDPISTSDVSIFARDANGSFVVISLSLSIMADGRYYQGMRYVDVSGPNFLNVGDKFILNKTVFAVGSSFSLVRPDGIATYAAVTLTGAESPGPPSPTNYDLIILIVACAVTVSISAFVLHIKRKMKDVQK